MGIEARQKTILKKLNEKSVVVACRCGVDYRHDLKGWEPAFVEEFNQYENLGTECPECGEVTFFNINIPPTRAEDIDQEPFLPDEEKQQRENIRALLWKLRPDLDETEREKVEKQQEKELEELHGADIETVRAMYRREIDLLTE